VDGYDKEGMLGREDKKDRVHAWLGDKAASIYGVLFVPTFLHGLEVYRTRYKLPLQKNCAIYEKIGPKTMYICVHVYT